MKLKHVGALLSVAVATLAIAVVPGSASAVPSPLLPSVLSAGQTLTAATSASPDSASNSRVSVRASSASGSTPNGFNSTSSRR